MKLGKTIKKVLGIIYVSLFSFALSVETAKSGGVETFAVDSTVYDLSWSWNDLDYPTACYTAEYHDNDYDCTIVATPQSATYDIGEATLEVTCLTDNDGSSNAPQELVGQTILFNYDVLSANTDGDPLYFSGTRDGNTESIELSRSIVDITGNSGSQEDEYYFEEAGSLYYHGQDGEDYDVTILDISYYSYMQNPDIVLNVIYGDIQQGVPVVVSGSFDPEPQESGSYSGTLTCYLPVTAESAELDLSGITLTIIDTPEVSWSYVDGYLSYSTSAYTVSQTVQTQIVQTEADAFTISYAIYTENGQAPEETINVYFTNAEYNDESGNGYYGMLSGECDVIDDPSYITIYAVVEPDLLDPVLYDDGWNYDEDDHILVYWDSEHEDANYTFSYAEFYQYKCEAVIIHSGTITGAIDTVTCHILEAVAVFDNSTQSITFSGYLAPEMDYDTMTWPKTDQYVELYFSANDDIREYYQHGWNYSQSLGEFIYMDATDDQVYDSLDYTSAEFRIGEYAVDNYFDITYSVRPEGQNDPTTESFHIYAASYEQGNTGGYDITGKIDMDYEGETYVIPVSFNVADMEIKHIFVEGFQYDSQNHILVYYHEEEVPYITEMTQVIWNYFGEESLQNEVLIDYTIYSAQDVIYSTERVTIKQAQVDEPGGQSNDGYINGFYKGNQVVLATSTIDYKNEIVDGFNYLDGLDQLIYFDFEDDARYSVAVTSIIVNVGKQTAFVYSNNISDENVSTENNVITLTNPTVTQQQTQQQNGIVVGYFASIDKQVTLITPILTITNDTGNGWHYESNELKYYDALYTEDYISFDFSFATYNVDDEVMEIQYEIDYSTPTQGQTSNTYDAIHIINPTINERIIDEETSYEVTGSCREVNVTVTLTIPSYYENSTGWHYDTSDGLYYNDSTYGGVPHEFYDAVYYADRSYIVITYTLKYYEVTNAELNDIDEELVITNPQFEEEDLDVAIFYKVTGYCEALDQNIEVEIPHYSTLRTGWEYNNDGLFYTDEEYGEIDIGVSRVDYYEDTKTVLVTYNLFYEGATEGEVADKTEVFTIENVTIEEVDITGKTSYIIRGYSPNVSCNVELEYSILNRMSASWVYDNRGDMYIDLIWDDPLHPDYITVLSEANYNEELKTVNFVYCIYTYEVHTGDGETIGSDVGPVTEEPTLVLEKDIHMTEVQTPYKITQEENPEFEETMVFVRGTNLDVPEATLLSVPESIFNTISYDPEAGTITWDQQIDIKELLPEETSVDNQRMEESVTAISSETAHEIIVTVNDAHEQNDAALANNEITPEKHAENRQIIETVTEASVVVGAVATTASDEGKAVDNALPEDNELGFTMDDTLTEFLALQMDYLLGRRKAPGEDDNSRGILRAGEPITNAGTINLNISAGDYAKMIGFVDTAVSNMKDAALQIRKCSSAKMKAVIKDYISVVKVSSFREFDEAAANDEFVEAVYKAIMLNMQQQVIEALKRDHKPSNNAEKEMVYQQQLAACEDYETFEEIVLEVLRQKYVSVTNGEIGIDDFRPIYNKIFRSWALDDPSLNESGITLEQLTTATIETTKTNANKFTYRDSVTKQESVFLIVFVSAIAVGAAAAIATPVIVSRTKHRRRAK